jgi:hypothetical protein
MNIEDFIYWSENLPELENSAEMKRAIGTALIAVGVGKNPGPAIHAVSQKIIETFKENILPSADFIKHPANRVSAFASEAEWLAAYLHYLIQKSDSIILIDHEIDRGITKFMQVVDADDLGVCRGCDQHKHKLISLSDADYSDVPPFHFGCRCSILFLK